MKRPQTEHRQQVPKLVALLLENTLNLGFTLINLIINQVFIGNICQVLPTHAQALINNGDDIHKSCIVGILNPSLIKIPEVGSAKAK